MLWLCCCRLCVRVLAGVFIHPLPPLFPAGQQFRLPAYISGHCSVDEFSVCGRWCSSVWWILPWNQVSIFVVVLFWTSTQPGLIHFTRFMVVLQVFFLIRCHFETVYGRVHVNREVQQRRTSCFSELWNLWVIFLVAGLVMSDLILVYDCCQHYTVTLQYTLSITQCHDSFCVVCIESWK